MSTATESGAARSTSDSVPSRRRLILAVALALAVAGLAAAGTWWWSSDRVAAAVALGWQPRCVGAEVTTYRGGSGGFGEALSGNPVIASRPGARCVLRLVISNDSGRDVRVTGLTAPLAGPDTGGEWSVAATDDLPEVRALGTGIDAYLPSDVEVPAGSQVVLELGIERSERGCNDAGTWSVDGWPVLEVEALGLAHEVASEQPWIVRTFSGPCRVR